MQQHTAIVYNCGAKFDDAIVLAHGRNRLEVEIHEVTDNAGIPWIEVRKWQGCGGPVIAGH